MNIFILISSYYEHYICFPYLWIAASRHSNNNCNQKFQLMTSLSHFENFGLPFLSLNNRIGAHWYSLTNPCSSGKILYCFAPASDPQSFILIDFRLCTWQNMQALDSPLNAWPDLQGELAISTLLTDIELELFSTIPS